MDVPNVQDVFNSIRCKLRLEKMKDQHTQKTTHTQGKAKSKNTQKLINFVSSFSDNMNCSIIVWYFYHVYKLKKEYVNCTQALKK